MSDWIEMHALADGQLEGDAKTRAEANRAESPALQAEYEAVQALKNAVSRAESVSCTKTWEKCRARFAELDGRKRVESFVGRYAWGLCSIIFVVMLAGAIFNRMGSDRLGTGDVARALAGFAPTSRAEANPGVEMRNWFAPRSRDALTIVGAQRAILNGYVGTVYQLVDQHGPLAYVRVQGVSAVEGVEPMLEDRSLSVGKINDTNCVTWQSGSEANFLIADRSYEDLSKAAGQLREN